MQPEDLANAFATFADKVDMMSEVVDRFNIKLAEFDPVTSSTQSAESTQSTESTESTQSTESTESAATQGTPEGETAPPVPRTAVVEETVSDMPNSVLSLVEALNTWKGES